MNAVERLRGMAQLCPEGGSITLPGAFLGELLTELEATAQAPESPGAGPAVDLTVKDVAKRLGRGASTVRSWLEAAQIPEAYRMNGREWRIPEDAFRAFLERKRREQRKGGGSAGRGRKQAPDLGAWRKTGQS